MSVIINPDHNVPPVEVVIVSGESTDGLQDLPADCVGIPRSLELDSFGLDATPF